MGIGDLPVVGYQTQWFTPISSHYHNGGQRLFTQPLENTPVHRYPVASKFYSPAGSDQHSSFQNLSNIRSCRCPHRQRCAGIVVCRHNALFAVAGRRIDSALLTSHYFTLVITQPEPSASVYIFGSLYRKHTSSSHIM